VRRILLVAFIAALAPYLSAQRMISGGPHFAPSRGAPGFAPRGFNHGDRSRPFFYPLAYGDALYADYLSSTGYPVASQPPVIVVQSPPPSAPAQALFSEPAAPLMIELQGDHYVRVSGEDNSAAGMIRPESIRRPEKLPVTTQTPAPEAPVVLVFRDGHREEVSEYTIADGVLYARLDYPTDGSWNKKIELSSLNLPETTRTNQSRGVSFQIPHSPNEVILRP
jgi:hypothetical protein